ncbi:MAG: ribosome maturation factor RimP [Syntrophales bacterium]
MSGLEPTFFFEKGEAEYRSVEADAYKMETYEQQIELLAEPLIVADKLELVFVECLKMKTRWLVRIYIDKPGGVTVDDCAQVSDKLGDLLDVHDVPPGQYTLEISSPGLDRPLHRDKDFLKYCGSRVHVRLLEKLEGRRDLRGELIAYEDSDAGKVIVMSVDGQALRIPRGKVARANLEYTL